eukprot:CAMPEP_0185818540 /NCGR_PEP_ID=MMETSP1322-20130828/20783_1 /TAXON_ID=265543 /ORGANISM="Minutocellus polymorphus, Strain RCC2270" /LENGTH=177 /DNA_ID=CAMNT_0028515653 /DNA_START=18 /DNA_END=551 /DNA_ORIENTATION=-
MAELSREAVENLTRLKINFIAVDFDQTIIDIHTGGRWNGTSTELAAHIRPHFLHFLRAAADASLHLAVVTFSPQVGFVSDVLRTHFPAFADQVVIRGRDGSWSYEGRGMRNGKQAFMSSAVEELATKHPHVTFAKNTTVLIDDDANNTRIALKDGTRAIWLNPSDPDCLFSEAMKMT